jgi:hypothetical protein
MKTSVVVSLTILFLLGCDRSISPESESLTAHQEAVPVVILEEFEKETGVVSNTEGLRVGPYFDLRAYDSLHITFTLKRVAQRANPDRILVRIGPTFSISETVSDLQKEVRLTVQVPKISKRSFAAFSFLVLDTGVTLQLSQLRVIGWTLR